MQGENEKEKNRLRCIAIAFAKSLVGVGRRLVAEDFAFGAFRGRLRA